jgi:zinc transporter ZupT
MLGIFLFGILESYVIPHNHDEEHLDGGPDELPTSNIGDDNDELLTPKRTTRSSARMATPSKNTPVISYIKSKKSNKNDELKRMEVLNAKQLMRTSFITFIAMALHNLPEGLGVYLSSLSNPKMVNFI